MSSRLRKVLLAFVILVIGGFLLREPIVGLARGVYCGVYLRGDLGEYLIVSNRDGDWFVVGTDGRGMCRVINRAPTADLSRAARLQAYLSEETQKIYVAHLDGTGTREVVSPSGCHASQHVALSPDGQFLAYLDRDALTPDPDNPTCEVFVVEVASGDIRQLTFTSNAAFPEWSPDGSYLAYSTGAGDLFTIKREGGDPTQVTSMWGYGAAWDWSPDSQRLAAVNDQYDVVTMKRDGTDLQNFSRPNLGVVVMGLDWSPDGSTLALEVSGSRWTGTDIYGVDLNTKQMYPLLATPASERNFRWLQDGSHALYFTDANRDLLSFNSAPTSLRKVNLRNGVVTQLVGY